MNTEKNRDLDYYLINNDLPNFIATYEKGSKEGVILNLEGQGIEVFPFIEYVLNHEKENFNIDYINFILRHKETQRVINFFETIKDKFSQHNPIRGLVINIIRNNDIKLLHYLTENEISSLGAIQDKSYVVGTFFDYKFQEGLAYYRNLPHFELFIIKQLAKQLKKSEPDWQFAQELLSLKNVELFKSLIMQNYETTLRPIEVIMDQFKMKSLYYTTNNRVSKPQIVSHDKEQKIWLQYTLQCNLSTKAKSSTLKI